jgi:hypothetical protein
MGNTRQKFRMISNYKHGNDRITNVYMCIFIYLILNKAGYLFELPCIIHISELYHHAG